jgi:hypothetical protein
VGDKYNLEVGKEDLTMPWFLGNFVRAHKLQRLNNNDKPFSDEHRGASSFGVKPFVAVRNPKIGVGRPEIDIRFLPNRMSTVNETVDSRLLADLNKRLPGHQGTGDRSDGINHRDHLLPGVAGNRLEMSAVPCDDGGL